MKTVNIKQASQTLEHLTSCKAPTHGVGDINKFSKFEQNSATQHWHYVSTQWNGWTTPPIALDQFSHRPRSLPPHRRHGIELSLKATALRDSEGWDPLCTPTAACRPPGCPPCPFLANAKKKQADGLVLLILGEYNFHSMLWIIEVSLQGCNQPHCRNSFVST